MELEELKRRLYKKDEELADRPKPPEEFEVGRPSLPQRAEPAPQWQEVKPRHFFWLAWRRRIFWILGVAAVLAVAGTALWYFLVGRHSFDKNQVALDIYGQERIVSGEEITYIVRYKNSAKVMLRDVNFSFIYPEQALVPEGTNVFRQGNAPVFSQNLSEILPGQEERLEFKVRILGDRDSQHKFLAKLTYRPANISAEFVNEASFVSTVFIVPLVLSFDLPEKIVSGQTMNFALQYLNTSDTNFTDMKIKIEYPPGFNFNTSHPSPSDGNNVWPLSEIGAQEEGKILINGTVSGHEGESKIFRCQIGLEKEGVFIVYAQTINSPQISVPPLYIEQSLLYQEKAITNLGESLSYKLKYRNTTDVAIGPIVVNLKIDSRAVDWGSVQTRFGFFSSASNTITWNVASLSSLSSLAAGQEGELEFSLKVKEKLPVNNFADKNFTIVTVASIDSPNVPPKLIGTQLKGENQFTVQVDSRLVLNMKGYYYDNLLPNSGPIPPRVGQKTTFTIYWQILNIANDLSEVTVESYLPSYIEWQNRVFPQDGNLKYEPATGKVTWAIGRLPAATGILLPVKQITFQIGLIPSITQLDQVVEIVKKTKISGQDDFTGSEISASVLELKSSLPDDPGVGWEKGRVVQ